MPEKDGKLTPPEREAVINWLNTKWTNKSCWACGYAAPGWNLDEYLARASIERGSVMVLGGPAYVFVVLSCKQCAHTVLFNSLPIFATITPTQAQATKEDGDAKTE